MIHFLVPLSSFLSRFWTITIIRDVAKTSYIILTSLAALASGSQA